MITAETASALETAFRSFPSGICVYLLENPADSLSLRLVYVNEEAVKTVGVDKNAMLGKYILNVFPSIANNGTADSFANVVRTGQPCHIDEFFYLDHHIAGQWFKVAAFPIEENLVAVSFTNITESKTGLEKDKEARAALESRLTVQKQTLKRLSMITREWTAIFDAIPDCVAVIGKNFQIKRVNRALSDLLKCQPSDIIGKTCYQVIHGLPGHWETCPHSKCMETRETTVEEVDDPVLGFPLEVTCVPYFDENGELTSSIHIARNISAQKQAIKEQEKLIRELKNALENVNLLSGLLPICANCKKIRNDSGYWEQIEAYIIDHSEAEFTHGICPDCIKKLYPDIE